MIKNKIKNILILFIILPVLASCAGTGTKSLSMINLNVDSDETAVFFVRKNRFVASAGLVKISLDGNEVGKLGVGEMERINIEPGSHTARVSIGNILQAGVGSDAVAFNADEGKAYYFIVDYDQGLFTGKWSITETSKNGFTKALN
jgi:hypothetical protein